VKTYTFYGDFIQGRRRGLDILFRLLLVMADFGLLTKSIVSAVNTAKNIDADNNFNTRELRFCQ